MKIEKFNQKPTEKDPRLENASKAWQKENDILREMLNYGKLREKGPLNKENQDALWELILSYNRARKETTEAIKNLDLNELRSVID